VDLRPAQRGWCLYDWANSAFATVILAAVFPVYLSAIVPPGGAEIHLFGLRRVLSAASLWGYAVSASMLLVAFCAPALGALADGRKLRFPLLIAFALPGACATALLATAGPGDHFLALALFLVANIGFAGGNIFYNAFLPSLAAGLAMDRLSARGYALGYLGGGLALLLVFILVKQFPLFGLADAGAATRAGLLLTGLWWGGFALPAFWLLRSAPPPLAAPRQRLGGWRGYLELYREIRRYPELARFLIAFLCYNDGIQTIIVVAALYGKEALGLDQGTILACFLMIQFVAMPATLLFGRLTARLGAKGAILLGLGLFLGITAYAFYLRHAWQFWLLAFLVALVFGGCQALSRSLYGSLIPRGKEAEFFSFYAISDKFASILGPFVFALLADLTGSTRLAILSLGGFFLLGGLLLTRVDVERGRHRAMTGAQP
jgi:MFS transporter, UMF1 family